MLFVEALSIELFRGNFTHARAFADSFDGSMVRNGL